MGFFSDLKDDLSEMQTKGNEADTKAEDGAEAISLAEMLEHIDDNLPGELQEGTETPATEYTEGNNAPEKAADSQMQSLLEEAFGQEQAQEPVPAEEPAEPEDTGMAELLGQIEESPAEAVQEEQNEMNEFENEDSKGAEREMEIEKVRVAVDETSVITEGMMITGDIMTEGSIDVIGTVSGNIDALGKLNITGHINGNSKAAEIFAEGAKINGEVVSEGAVKIGASSVVIGNISAISAAIAGAVKGDIDVRGPVILDSSAIVMGNIKSKSVQINNGAVIEGMCSQCYADVSPTSFFDEYKPEIKKAKSK